ncbi:MAG TPA: ABC transporter ATP-binding protein [Bacteroidia bacterium]
MKKITPFERFRRLLKLEKREIGRVYSYAIFQGLVNLSIPLGIQAIVNLIQGGKVSTSWIVLVVIVVSGVILTGVLQLYQLRLIENLQQRIFANAAFEFTYRLPKFTAASLEHQSAPELMNRFFDVMSVQKGLSKVLIDFSAAVLQVFFGLLLLSFYHPFFIFFGFGLLLLLISIIRLTARKGLDTSLRESKYKYKVASWLEDIASTRLSFKMVTKGKLHMEKSDQNISSYLDAREGHFNVLRLQYILLIVFKALVAAALLIIGGLLVLNQQMNIGQFIAAEIIILLVINSVEKLILNAENFYDVITALEKIGHVTDLDLDKSKNGTLIIENSTKKGFEIQIKDLDYTFPNSGKKVFNRLNLTIKSGARVCLTGGTGSGKSTLLGILAGIYDEYKGTIVYNGLPEGNYDTLDLRSKIGARFTTDNLFNGTVYDNIVMGRKGISIQRLQEVTEALFLNEAINKLRNGFESNIGHENIRLSKSIVQKLLLARSIIHDPDLLLIENGLEYLDEAERKAIVKYLISPERRWTLVLTSVLDEVADVCDPGTDLEKCQINLSVK